MTWHSLLTAEAISSCWPIGHTRIVCWRRSSRHLEICFDKFFIIFFFCLFWTSVVPTNVILCSIIIPLSFCRASNAAGANKFMKMSIHLIYQRWRWQFFPSSNSFSMRWNNRNWPKRNGYEYLNYVRYWNDLSTNRNRKKKWDSSITKRIRTL